MGVKVLAGFVAAVAVTAVGVYVAFSGGPDSSAGLPVSEGSSCLSCCRKASVSDDHDGTTPQTFPTDALGACTGGLSAGVNADPGKACTNAVHCCDD